MKSFEKLIGNDAVKEVLNKAIQSKKVTHSYLFIGPSGIGKTLFAKEFAKMMLCQEENKPCGSCKSCIEFENNNHPDFSLLSSEEASIKIDQIRKIQHTILEKPIISNRKVYIIKDADTMTKEAQNCLLKTLEEPPSYITMLLIGANENSFLTTIKSRCLKIVFNKISDNILIDFLIKQEGFEEITTNRIQAFGGSIEKAIQINQKKEIYQEIEKVFLNKEKVTLLEVLNKLDAIYQHKEDIYEILDYINVILLEKSIQDPCYLKYINAIEQTKKNLKANSNYDMSIDNLLYQIWEE